MKYSRTSYNFGAKIQIYQKASFFQNWIFGAKIGNFLKKNLTFVFVFAEKTMFHQWACGLHSLAYLEVAWLARFVPRPISYCEYCEYYSDVKHNLTHVVLESCEVGGPQVKLFPHFLRTLSNGQEWKWISSVDCKIREQSIIHTWQSFTSLGHLVHLQFRFEVMMHYLYL